MFSHHANKDDTRASKALVFMNICIHYRGIIHCGLKCGNKKKSSAIYWSCTFIHNSNFLPKENQNPSSLVSNLRKHIKRCTIPTYSSIQFLNVLLVVFLQKKCFHSFIPVILFFLLGFISTVECTRFCSKNWCVLGCLGWQDVSPGHFLMQVLIRQYFALHCKYNFYDFSRRLKSTCLFF